MKKLTSVVMKVGQSVISRVNSNVVCLISLYHLDFGLKDSIIDPGGRGGQGGGRRVAPMRFNFLDMKA